MFSCPPATTTEALPRMICSAATWMAFVPEPHAMFTVNAGFSSPSPLRYATWRAGLGPFPAWRAWPKTSSSTSAAWTFARSRAAVTAWTPRSTAATSENAPRNFPTGVRAPSTMTARCTASIIGWASDRPGPGLGHVSDQATPLLLGGTAPNAVALSVLHRPGQAHLLHGTDGAIGQRQAGLLLGRGEENLGIEAVTGGSFLPMIRRADLLGQIPHVDLQVRHRVHATCSGRQRPGPVSSRTCPSRPPLPNPSRAPSARPPTHFRTIVDTPVGRGPYLESGRLTAS